MQADVVTANCFCCDQKLYFRPDSDHGHVIERYGVLVCTPCYERNADGWHSTLEERLLGQLRHSRVKLPQRNAQGLLPRD
ncbi:hypothetical protein [Pseudoxanthomonas sp. JBR18]|uniref:hypothetical protein n=1 Tax=Pseudoxanthomonas sp. JBR18 TaxID=2969308 RepID=UPI00230681BC|nr:hypothetical protein [Pseudoxanthomonas sp. JBR18]WCE04702.1 hypothetical protein PJ250_01535 [Pseudoxanthomonas sp. JBR18]